jgi:hypothetical protein
VPWDVPNAWYIPSRKPPAAAQLQHVPLVSWVPEKFPRLRRCPRPAEAHVPAAPVNGHMDWVAEAFIFRCPDLQDGNQSNGHGENQSYLSRPRSTLFHFSPRHVGFLKIENL